MSYKTIHTDFRNDYTNARDALLNEELLKLAMFNMKVKKD